MNLKDQLVVVTGVSKGIGRATVIALLEAGAKVGGWGRTDPNLTHAGFYFVKTDISDWDQVQKAFTETTSFHKAPVKGLINNAGLGYSALLEDTSRQQWLEMFDTNVHGLFYCCKTVIPQMKQEESGHIVNIASIAGNTGIETMSGYCGTKHAVRGISHSLYKELRNFGIKVTCIYPGSVKTNFFDNISTVQVSDNMMMPEDIASTILHALQSDANYHHVDIEVRPLMPMGKTKSVKGLVKVK